jgi:fido (protein-threonine AMPylation protein)
METSLGIRSATQPLGVPSDFKGKDAEVINQNLQDLGKDPVRGNFDLNHLQAIHAKTFREVIGDAAGELRTVDIVKRSDTGIVSHFVAAKDIEKGAALIADNIKAADNFRGLTKDEWASQIAQTYSQVNQLHPFRNGNDATNRAFVQALGKEGGFEIDYAKVNVQDWQKASIESFKGNTTGIEKIFNDISEPVREKTIDGIAKDSLRVDISSRSDAQSTLPNDAATREAQRLGLEISKPLDVAELQGNVKGIVVAAKEDFVLIKTSATTAIAVDNAPTKNFKAEEGTPVVIHRENNTLYVEPQNAQKDRSAEPQTLRDRDYGER